MPGRSFVLVVIDREAREFSVEGPMTDDRSWNKSVVDAQRVGRNIRCFSMGVIPPDDAAAVWQCNAWRSGTASRAIDQRRHDEEKGQRRVEQLSYGTPRIGASIGRDDRGPFFGADAISLYDPGRQAGTHTRTP